MTMSALGEISRMFRLAPRKRLWVSRRISAKGADRETSPSSGPPAPDTFTGLPVSWIASKNSM